MASTLVAHVDAHTVTRDALTLLPDPAPLGPRHRPIPHAVLVDQIHAETAARGLVIAKEHFALGHGGATLFAAFDFARPMHGDDAGFALGLRSSQDQSLALKGCAGSRVFVCDNLALSGSVFAFNRRHTCGLDLAATIRAGFDRYEEQADVLAREIAGLRETEIPSNRAKEIIYDAFARDVIPARLFSDVHRFYFEPAPDRPDCEPRTLWGLHNAFTRAFKRLAPARAWAAGIALGRLFGLGGSTRES